jgi:hypothetical protein
MRRLRTFWLALIFAAGVECILVIAAATFAFPFFDPGGAQHDTEFVTLCREVVGLLHFPSILLLKRIFPIGRFVLPLIVITNVAVLTVLFWILIAFKRRFCEKRDVA